MLNEKDIDSLMLKIQSKQDAFVYYVAHMIEGRETNTLDEHSYKDVSKFKVVKVKVIDIQNAYFEYEHYVKTPSDYHIEEEECYYHPSAKYIHYFVCRNGEKSYSKDLNPRMPSIIYGYKRKIFVDDTIKDVIDPSPVKEVYTNVPSFGNYNQTQIGAAFTGGKLDWKYKKLAPPANVDGINYSYLTSDWYILTLENYPMVEKPLINIHQHSGYFIDTQDAFRYIDQLVA